MAVLLAEVEAQRRTRMWHNARRLQRRGWLRAGLTLARPPTSCGPTARTELYDLLVLRSGWSIERYGAFMADALIAALLPSDAAVDTPES